MLDQKPIGLQHCAPLIWQDRPSSSASSTSQSYMDVYTNASVRVVLTKCKTIEGRRAESGPFDEMESEETELDGVYRHPSLAHFTKFVQIFTLFRKMRLV
jgi:hypothetical protein